MDALNDRVGAQAPQSTGSPPPADEIRSQLDRILRSDQFAAARQPSKLLSYLVEETLAGRSEQLEAYAVAVDALDKRQSFDPTIDTIVRSTLRRLRKRLDQYYTSIGRNDPVEIRIPVRSYVPLFRWRETASKQLSIGGTISHYRVIEKIGEGGMGIVYKAVDLKLDRFVVLKFPLEDGDAAEEYQKRLVEEARAAAAVEHPNLCPVYEVGEDSGRRFIVSPFVPGEGLDHRIARGPLPVLGLLEIAEQLARGLAAAHQKGVVHCDIKPTNVIVTEDDSGGRMAKIIDFGIARPRVSTTNAPHLPAGTLAYMSPEQLRGEDLDPRTDIWSLGVVLHEMASGHLPFGGSSALTVRHAILEDDPEPLSTAAPSAPIELEWIVEKALAKEPSNRYQSATDLAVDLEALRRKVIAGRTTNVVAQAGGSRPSRLRRWMLASAVALVGTVAVVWLTRSRPTANPDPVIQFTLPTEGVVRTPAISPDGRYIAYVGAPRAGARWTLTVHDLRLNERREIAEAANISRPVWSPDSLWVAYYRQRSLLRSSVTGGGTAEVAPLPDGVYIGGAWSSDGQWIYFGIGRPPTLYRVRSGGGQPEPIDGPADLGESPPFLLAGTGAGPTLLYTTSENDQSRIVWHDFAHAEGGTLLTGGIRPVVAGDYLLYQLRTNTWPVGPLVAAPLMRHPLQLGADRVKIHSSVDWHSVSNDGTLVYLDRTPAVQQLVWRDRSGRQVGRASEPHQQLDRPQVSPDGNWVAVSERVHGDESIWLEDVSRGISRRLTPGDVPVHPIDWLKKTGAVAYYEDRFPGRVTMLAGLNQGRPKELYGRDSALPEDLSSDGRFLLLQDLEEQILGYVELSDANEASKFVTLLDRVGGNRAAEFSPDDRYVAYSSQEAQRSEVYVQAFPSGLNWLVSAAGGNQVRWSPRGDELFYVQDDALMSVPIRIRPTFSFGPATMLFRNPNLRIRYDEPVYDVSPDGQRFVIIETIESEKTIIHVVLNGLRSLRDLAQ